MHFLLQTISVVSVFLLFLPEVLRHRGVSALRFGISARGQTHSSQLLALLAAGSTR